jgi:hypothetical protein
VNSFGKPMWIGMKPLRKVLGELKHEKILVIKVMTLFSSTIISRASSQHPMARHKHLCSARDIPSSFIQYATSSNEEIGRPKYLQNYDKRLDMGKHSFTLVITIYFIHFSLSIAVLK